MHFTRLCIKIMDIKQNKGIFFYTKNYTLILLDVHYFDAESSKMHKITHLKKQMAAILYLSFTKNG